MSKKKMKAWLVSMKPPKGQTPKLAIRTGDIGAKRTAVRNYQVGAETRAEAQSIAEQQERAIADQLINAQMADQLTDDATDDQREALREKLAAKAKPWVVDSVTAA